MTARSRLAGRVAAIAAVCALLAIVWSRLDGFRPLPSTEYSLRPDDPVVLAQGERLYAIHCAACHGAQLEGQPDWKQRRPDGRLPAPPHDETGHTWHHPDEQLVRMTRMGVARLAHRAAPPRTFAGHERNRRRRGAGRARPRWPLPLAPGIVDTRPLSLPRFDRCPCLQACRPATAAGVR